MWRDKYVWYKGTRCKILVWGKNGYFIEYGLTEIWVSATECN